MPRRKLPIRWMCYSTVACLFVGLAPLAVQGATPPTPGQPLPPWQRGMLDIHQINTGTGDAAFFVLPDGTTLLLDAAAVNRSAERPAGYDTPQRPNASLRAGQWVARYIQRMHPEGTRGVLDYAALTHFHGDHMGTLTEQSPSSKSGAYRLTGITDVGDAVTIRRLLDRGWPSYDYPAPSGSAMMKNYRAFLQWQAENNGLQSERFEPGRVDQIILRRNPEAFPDFEVRNIAANGYVWTGSGTTARNRFPEGILPNENNCSLAFRLTYGAFRYFNGGDMAGFLSPNAAAWTEMESAVAWVTGPVDVHAINHHGTPDGANAFFLSVLQPRIHVLSVYAASQPGPDVMRRMLSPRIYPGPRDVFLTNAAWPGRQEHLLKLYGETETAWLLDRIREVASSQGHVLVRVEPGGARYQVIVIDDNEEGGKVLSVHGPYLSRGAP
jgi:beta-lactamase superfamily II metal-dependent hydrolase